MQFRWMVGVIPLAMMMNAMVFGAVNRQNIRIETLPADYHAKVGDTITFKISLVQQGQVVVGKELAYEITWDTITPIESGTFTTSDEPKTFTAKANHPGFIRLWVYEPGRRDDFVNRNESGVAVEPEKIVSRQTMPDDFDAFWDRQRKSVYDVPMYPHLTPVESGIEGFETFDLQINAPGGLNCSGYYGRPKNAAPKSLPAVLYVHASGVYSSLLIAAKSGHRYNAIVYDMNSHGVPNGLDAKYYQDLANGPLKQYALRGQDDKETAYYRVILLRIIRAMQFLKSQPEWDGKTLIVYGGSEGGFLATAAAALDPDVTLFVAHIPYRCERLESPEIEAHISGDEKEAYVKRVMETSRYFDAVNFARHTKAAAIVGTGFVDTVCKPSGNFAMFNALSNPEKFILEIPNYGHGFDVAGFNPHTNSADLIDYYIKNGKVPREWPLPGLP